MPFYRTCRLVVMKRKKDPRKLKWPPGSASGSGGSGKTGVRGSCHQAGAIRAELLAQICGDAIVEEYAQVKGLPPGDVDIKGKDQVLHEAVQFMQLLLLRDLRPPWVVDAFPQALPGEGVLSRYTRPLIIVLVRYRRA